MYSYIDMYNLCKDGGLIVIRTKDNNITTIRSHDNGSLNLCVIHFIMFFYYLTDVIDLI